PTSANCCPARFLFLRSRESRERLRPHLTEGNVDKTMAAPVTAIIGYDTLFYEKSPRLFPHNPGARDWFAGEEKTGNENAFRNGTLQGAYLIIAARAIGLDCGPMSGFDNEGAPTLGGLYLAPLEHEPDLTTLVSIGERVPGEAPSATFNGLGEGGAFDGRLVGFWGAWGEETRTVRLYCPTEGNRDRIAYCNQQLVCTDTGVTEADPNSICEDNRCYQEKQVPAHQGIFVHDTRTGRTWVIAKADEDFDDFLFWNYSGRTPCTGKGHGEEGVEEDGEFVRWRSSAFLAVAGPGRAGAAYRVVFKARTGEFDNGVYTDPVDGIYLRRGPGRLPIETVLDTTMAGQSLDPQAPADSVINELGLEREGLRGRWLTVNAKIGVEGSSEEDGIAGIYLTEIR
ncbi:MAG: malonic semialdehyde reductase, partial [Desulfuromonadales bacterium]